MGEQPLYTTRAHVFQIDPVSKKSWLPSSKQAVAVSFFFDNTRNSFRIISVDGSKAIINSIITNSMSFTKTSQKFGQWADVRASTVYGLGFSSEGELNNFVEKFNELKEAALSGQGSEKKDKTMTNGVQENKENGSPRNHTRQLSTDGSSTAAPTTVPILASTDAQLKYENDRLKIALAQSSTNAKKWEMELQTLKNNNARLTTALQESTTNVEEWKKQLTAYKEENAKLKKKVQDLESRVSGVPVPGSSTTELEQRLQSIDLSHQAKEKEVEELTRRLQSSLGIEHEAETMKQKLQESQAQTESLKQRVSELQAQLVASSEGKRLTDEQLHQLHGKMGTALQQLNGLHQNMAQQLNI